MGPTATTLPLVTHIGIVGTSFAKKTDDTGLSIHPPRLFGDHVGLILAVGLRREDYTRRSSPVEVDPT